MTRSSIMIGAAHLAACHEQARACELAYSRARILSGTDGNTGHSTAPAASKPGRRAWITLLTNRSYAVGIRALYNTIVEVDSDYPLVVMVTASVPADVCAELASQGCILHEVEVHPPPPGASAYACPAFMECWTKLRAWELDYEKLVYVDADMVMVRNMDELLLADESPQEHSISAVCI